MGNIEQKMAKAKPLDELASVLKHIEQTRSDSQIQITNKLSELLSDLNTKRISSHRQVQVANKDWSQYVFICVQGLPAIDNQFSFLNLPGQVLYFSCINFSEKARKSSNSERFKMIFQSTFEAQSQRLNQLIKSVTKKNIVFIYHSIGNFVLSMYFYYYGYGISQRIKGMIDIAGGPLRYYISAQILVPVLREVDFKEILQNDEKVHRLFNKNMAKTGFQLNGFETKYQTLSFIHYMNSKDYGQIFDATWNHPKVLKLFIHGRKDTLFESKLLNEKAIYYTYRRQLQPEYESRLKQKYRAYYKIGDSPSNIQERFILCIPNGQHSVHMQERNREVIKNAVLQYLDIVHQ